MERKVAIVKEEYYDYFRIPPFRPSEKYPETPFEDFSEGENRIYEMVREGFYLMGYDKDHYGKKIGTPLGML